MKTRKQLAAEVAELKQQVQAQESRKAMRARLTEQLAAAKKELDHHQRMNETLLDSMTQHGYDRESGTWQAIPHGAGAGAPSGRGGPAAEAGGTNG